MPAAPNVPAWAAELAVAYESVAASQFILYGNVHDRLVVDGALVNLADFLQDALLSGFGVVITYDLGNGLAIERGGEQVEQWQGAELRQLAREPLPALQW